jgi:hypothetical protein
MCWTGRYISSALRVPAFKILTEDDYQLAEAKGKAPGQVLVTEYSAIVSWISL